MFGIWWSFITSMRFINSTTSKSQHKKPIPYRGSVIMPVICLPCKRLRRSPLESWFIVVTAGIGLAGEVITGLHYVKDPVPTNAAPDTSNMGHGDMGHGDMGHEHSQR
jgi:hypothetical protein